MIIRPFYKESILEKTYSHKTFYTRDIYKTEPLRHIAICIDEKYLQFLDGI